MSPSRYPFDFASPEWNSATAFPQPDKDLPSCRGKFFSRQAANLRSLMLEAFHSPEKIVGMPCSTDALSSKLVQEAGFPVIFLSGFAVAGGLALPDTGYIALEDMTKKIQETARSTSVPILADGDTGYGSPVNMRRTVESFALAGAAGIMIEDQTWPKRCGHSKGKAVVGREEAYARVQAAVDARNNGLDIWIIARTDSLYMGYDEALERSRRFIEIGADCIFVEALPDKSTMGCLIKDLNFPCMANQIPGGRTEPMSGLEMAQMGYCCCAYPFSILSAQIKGVRKALEDLKASMEVGHPPMEMTAKEVFDAVGFNTYYELEERYKYEGQLNGSAGHQWQGTK